MTEADYRKGPRLRREAGLLQVVLYGVGNIIGAGVYVLIGGAAGLAGNAIGISFIVGAIVALFTGLSYAELSSEYPKAASEYVYLQHAYGRRSLSFVIEWMMIISEIVGATAVALGFASYLGAILSVSPVAIAAALLVLLTAIAMVGIRTSLRLDMLLSSVAMLGLIIVIVAGSGKIGSVDYLYAPKGMSGVLAAAALVFFAYIGFDNIANLAEETKDPKRTLPKALLIAMAVTTALYVLVGLAAVGLVPWQQLMGSSAPLALAASATFGKTAYYVITVIALLTTFNTALVFLISSSRSMYGMARDGSLPRILGRVNGRTRTPVFASLAVLAIALIVLQIRNIDTIAEITGGGALIVFAAVNLAVLQLRIKKVSSVGSFRIPLSVHGIPVTAVLGAVSCICLMTLINTESLLLMLAIPATGIVCYLVFNLKRSR